MHFSLQAALGSLITVAGFKRCRCDEMDQEARERLASVIEDYLDGELIISH